MDEIQNAITELEKKYKVQNAVDALEKSLLAQAILAQEKRDALSSIMPAEVLKSIEDVEAEYGDKEELIAKRISLLDSFLRAQVTANGVSIPGKSFTFTFSKG